MKKLMLVGFRSSLLREVVKNLKNNNTDYEISTWFGGNGADYKTSSIKRANAKKGIKGSLTDNDQFYGSCQQVLLNNENLYYKAMYRFIDHQMRNDKNKIRKSHPLETLHDYQNYFHITIDIIANKLIENNIDIVLFSAIPHLGYDSIVYEAAKLLNFNTIIIDSVVIPDKFISMQSMEDCGKIQFGLNDSPPMAIEKHKRLEHFYMKNGMQDKVQTGKLGFKDVLLILAYVIKLDKRLLISPKKLSRLLKQAAHIKSIFPDWRDPFNRFFHKKQIAYFQELMRYEYSDPDLNQDFVYFPLQLQPEMTTSALGGVYVDQVFAVEQLANIVPESYKIIVKENPKQQHFMRNPLFFHRLNRIKNVVFVPSYTSTHELLDRSKFVAAVTGTVGWEAIRQGKPALIFGHPWYLSLPGIVPFHQGLTIDEILNTKIDHQELEKMAGELANRMHDGVTDGAYSKIATNFNREDNGVAVANQLHQIIMDHKHILFQ